MHLPTFLLDKLLADVHIIRAILHTKEAFSDTVPICFLCNFKALLVIPLCWALTFFLLDEVLV